MDRVDYYDADVEQLGSHFSKKVGNSIKYQEQEDSKVPDVYEFLQLNDGHNYFITYPELTGQDAANLLFGKSNYYGWKPDPYSFEGQVRELTELAFVHFHDLINPEKLPRDFSLYHVDHILSACTASQVGLPIEIVASPINLQMLPKQENLSKGKHSWLSPEKLISRYREFLKTEKGDQWRQLVKSFLGEGVDIT